ncbi:MAG: TlpA family protein disulfide reductase [Terriglobia bacterium]
MKNTVLTALLMIPILASPGAASPASAPTTAEVRVVQYLRTHVKPGEPLVVSQLYSQVFTTPPERKALNKLYNAFFRIPLFVAQYQQKFDEPPSLTIISQQFDLHVPGEADVLLRVMESDPRVPRFLTRDPKTGQITHVEVKMIKSDPRFGQVLSRQLGGWQGKEAPAFDLTGVNGVAASSALLKGKVYLLDVWFTGCPPCMKETPELVALQHEFAASGFTVIGANADQMLGLDYDDAARAGFARQMKIDFPIVYWTKASDAAYGHVAIFPTLFLVNRDGLILNYWVGYTRGSVLGNAVAAGLAPAAKNLSKAVSIQQSTGSTSRTG